MDTENYLYKAFISYRHKDLDRKWAKWLFERLETYRTPKQLVREGKPVRIGRIFRDDDEIPASTDLSNQLQTALMQSEYLIVICSKDTPESKWIRQEITFFQENGRSDKILALLIDGEPHESFPPELRFITDQETGEKQEVEPLASDIRPRSDEKQSQTQQRAFLRIAASLLRCKYDDLKQREQQRQRKQRRQKAGAIAAMLSLAIAGGLYYWDYNRIKTSYYADFGTHYGEPFGIGKLNKETVQHRESGYVVNRRRGKVVEIRRENGFGYLSAKDGNGVYSEPWLTEITRWSYAYEDNAKLSKVIFYDEKNQAQFIQRYEFSDDGKEAVVSFQNMFGGAQTLDSNFSLLSLNFNPGSETKSQIAQFRLTFDELGHIQKRQYETIWGKPVKDVSGSYGRTYKYTEAGQIQSISNIDQIGKVFIGKTGITQNVREYNNNGIATYR